MVKRFLPILFVALAKTCLADVDSDVQKCLTENSTQAGTKTACVQKAINNATVGQNGQASQLYNAYSRFAQSDLNSLSGGGGSQGGIQGAPAAAVYPNQVTRKPPAVQAQPQAAPTNQAPGTTPQTQGGIKYY